MSIQALFYKSNDKAILRTFNYPYQVYSCSLYHVRQLEKELEPSMSTTITIIVRRQVMVTIIS